jgi:endonuclease/exonuclease/phosphatase family metal-dependent hydrolase
MNIQNPFIFAFFLVSLALSSLAGNASEQSLRVATFNVSIEATNYLSRKEIAYDPSRSKIVKDLLDDGDHSQIKNIAEIIQRTRPDVVLLNEFDYIADPKQGIELFIKNYLNVSQNEQPSIDYPYHYIAPVNTGLASPYDLDNDGKKTGLAGDAYGFGYYPGQYGMALLSRYPIKHQQIRTLQTFLWKDMPDALQPTNDDGIRWYSAEEWAHIKLSSKSHWDIPIETNAGIINIIAAHPTPPTFDGTEDRNGKRNHDEIRLLHDYLSNATYIVDDNGIKGGLKAGSRFVVMGDLNSSPNEGDAIKGAIQGLLAHPLVDSSCTPTSQAGKLLRPDKPFAAEHTAAWGLRVDYVLPSKGGLRVKQCGLFWPTTDDSQHALIATRKASSDHRLVWVDLLVE